MKRLLVLFTLIGALLAACSPPPSGPVPGIVDLTGFQGWEEAKVTFICYGNLGDELIRKDGIDIRGAKEIDLDEYRPDCTAPIFPDDQDDLAQVLLSIGFNKVTGATLFDVLLSRENPISESISIEAEPPAGFDGVMLFYSNTTGRIDFTGEAPNPFLGSADAFTNDSAILTVSVGYAQGWNALVNSAKDVGGELHLELKTVPFAELTWQ